MSADRDLVASFAAANTPALVAERRRVLRDRTEEHAEDKRDTRQ